MAHVSLADWVCSLAEDFASAHTPSDDMKDMDKIVSSKGDGRVGKVRMCGTFDTLPSPLHKTLFSWNVQKTMPAQ